MTGQMNAYLLLAAPFAPLAGAIAAALTGTPLAGKPASCRLSCFFATLGVAVSCLVSLYALYAASQGGVLHYTLYRWVDSDPFQAEIGLMIDGLTALMMGMVTSVSLAVHLYSAGYMKDEPGAGRFFACTAFFTFAMLMLVMAGNFLQLFFGWEAVGLASYLLIGFWHEKPAAANAGLRAFLVNRISDAFFLTGIALLFSAAGSFRFSDIVAVRHTLAAMSLPGTGWSLITVACLCLFIGAMGKSAQFPLHIWLPGSMEGPTPVSALIHAATMVTAGIFMVARLSPLFELSGPALSCMLITGAVTALFMGLVALVQNDIKQVIAYSTISQLGYMTAALGASAYSSAIFHLMTHAFFKALLFLAAGAVITAMNHDQDIRHMGGLKKYLPVAWLASLAGSLSLAGWPFFSGFYSKDSIVTALGQACSRFGGSFALAAAWLGIFVTAFYTFRLFFLVFHGNPRFGSVLPDNAGQNSLPPAEAAGLMPGEKPHPVPRIMTVSLVILAIPAILIGGLTITPLLAGDFLASAGLPGLFSPAGSRFEGPAEMALHGFLSPAFFLLAAGIALAAWLYLRQTHLAKKWAETLPGLYRLLLNQYYLPLAGEKLQAFSFQLASRLLVFGKVARFMENGLARLAALLGNGLWQLGEIRLIDGMIVHGSARLAAGFGSIIRRLQSGYLYHYAFVMVLGLLCLLLYFCR
ncbi:MAG: NADH-quinone oxidoreductase subunit L [Oxalobacter formigenes]|nr:NADH-quinone oxidoreductase subunit L [Oxalobacter formigenes]